MVQDMNENEQIISLLIQMEENQRKALEAHEKQLALAQAQLDRSNHTIRESIELQRTAVARQKHALWVVLPLVGVLFLLLVYLLLKHRVL